MESARIVADRLVERMAEEDEGGAPRLSFDELYRLIEKALVENDAYDVAKSLVISRSSDGSSGPGSIHAVGTEAGQIRLIRRVGRWFHGIRRKSKLLFVKRFFLSDSILNPPWTLLFG